MESNNKIIGILLAVIATGFLSSCTHNATQPEVELDNMSHLKVQPLPKAKDSQAIASIPSLVKPKPIIPQPSQAPKKSKGYTISALDAPIRDILFSIAQKAGYQIDIWNGVAGQLTINAVNQPLEDILQRIASQLDLNISVEEQVIVVKPDLPYWQNYRVDYVNIKRSTRDSIVMNMTVGGSVNPVAGGQATGSRSVVEVSSEHDFWNTLYQTLASMTMARSAAAATGNNAAMSATAAIPAALNPAQPNSQQTPPPAPASNTASNTASTSATRNLSSSNIVINPEAGLVMVYANAKGHQQVRNYIDDLTQRTERQVMIEASVVEVTLSKQHQSGIDWSNSAFKNLSNRAQILSQDDAVPIGENIFTATLTDTIGLDLNVGLKMLESFGDVKVLSSPKIMAVNNQSALLKVVDNEVYFTVNVSRSTSTAGTDVTYSTTVHTVPVGFMMSMTPFVNDNREVSINIRPTISRIIATVTDPNPDLKTVGVESLIPVVQEREMETVLKLRDKQTAVIGGLIEDRSDRKETGISWLSRLPLVGNKLFGYEETGNTKTELVIFIRPIIIDKPDIENGDLQHYRSFLKSKTGELQ